MTEPVASRRIVFQGLSALGVAAVLAGCGGDEEPASTSDPTAGSPSPSETSTPAEPPPSSASTSKKPRPDPEPALATTDEVPVGGGIVLTGQKIVIVQPTAGDFLAWSAICKHQGQLVGSVESNVITCPFHGSQYDSATGDVVGGPAPAGLDPIEIRVAGKRITLA